MQTSVFQPQSTGDILDTALRLYRRQWWSLIGIVVLVYAPFVFLMDRWRKTQSFGFLQSDFSRLIAWGFINNIWWLFGTGTLLTAALVYHLAHGYHGQAATLRSSYYVAFRRVAILVIASILPFTIDLLMNIVGDLASEIAIIIWFSVPLFSVYICIMWVGAHFLFVPQIIILEPALYNPIRILQRSWHLAHHSISRTVIILLVTKAGGMLLTSAPVYIILFIPSTWIRDHTLLNMYLLGYYTIIPVIIIPLQLAVYTVLYYDLRIRYEGYNLEFQLQQRLAEANARTIPM